MTTMIKRSFAFLKVRSASACYRSLVTGRRPFILKAYRPCLLQSHKCLNFSSHRQISTSSSIYNKLNDGDNEENLSIGKKFKKMFKDYWYVLVPVHVATSAVWFGGFYALCKSGIDVGAILQTFGASETYVEKLSNSEMGYFALAYACYKIATPVRYTVTVGGTTMTVQYLSNLGYLKTSQQVGEKFKEKADDIKGKADNFKQEVKDKRDEWKDKREKVIDEWREKSDKAKDEWVEAWRKFAQKKK